MQDTKQDAMQNKQEWTWLMVYKTWNQNTPNTTDTVVCPLDAPETNHEVEEAKEDDAVTAYNITDQEVRLQHKEEKYEVYMSTFSYKGDDSNLDSKTDIDSNVTAYPFSMLQPTHS